MSAGTKEKYKPKAIPQEPDGFRDWLKQRYPGGDHDMPWYAMFQLHPDIIHEFHVWKRGSYPIRPTFPSAAPLRAWKNQVH